MQFLTLETEITDLMKAAKTGDIALLHQNIGQLKQQSSKEHSTALMYACYYNHPECAQQLTKEQEMSNNYRVTALMFAASRNNVECIKLVLNEKKMKDCDGKTALIHSVLSNSYECAQLLTDEQMLKDSWGWAAIHYAADCGFSKYYKLLAQKVGSLSTKDGQTVLQIAVQKDHKEFVNEMIREDNQFLSKDKYCLIYSILSNNKELFDSFVNTQQRYQDDKKRTALMHSCLQRNAEFTRQLTKECGLQDDGGKTALMHAVMGRSLECTQLLLSETKKQDNYGYTALHYAAHTGFVEAYQLLKRDEDKILTKDKNTVLMTAAYSDQLEFCKLVVHQAGQRDASGRTALMKAACKGNLDCVKFLAPLEMSMLDNQKNSALMLAIQNRHSECIQFLQKEAQQIDSSRVSILFYYLQNAHYIQYSSDAMYVDLSDVVQFQNQVGVQSNKQCALQAFLSSLYTAYQNFVQYSKSSANSKPIVYEIGIANQESAELLEKMFREELSFIQHELLMKVCRLLPDNLLQIVLENCSQNVLQSLVRVLGSDLRQRSGLLGTLKGSNNVVIEILKNNVFRGVFDREEIDEVVKYVKWRKWDGL